MTLRHLIVAAFSPGMWLPWLDPFGRFGESSTAIQTRVLTINRRPPQWSSILDGFGQAVAYDGRRDEPIGSTSLAVTRGKSSFKELHNLGIRICRGKGGKRNNDIQWRRSS
jgi:hypothetical protein